MSMLRKQYDSKIWSWNNIENSIYAIKNLRIYAIKNAILISLFYAFLQALQLLFQILLLKMFCIFTQDNLLFQLKIKYTRSIIHLVESLLN